MVSPVLRAATRDLPDVPPLVQYCIGAFLAPILAWLKTLVYRPLLRRCAEERIPLARKYE
jgi:hypothetical protein